MKILIPPIKNLLAAPFASQKNKKTRKKQQQFGFQKRKNAFRTPGMYRFFSPATWRCFPQQKKGADLGGLLGTLLGTVLRFLLRFLLGYLLAFWSFFHASEIFPKEKKTSQRGPRGHEVRCHSSRVPKVGLVF